MVRLGTYNVTASLYGCHQLEPNKLVTFDRDSWREIASGEPLEVIIRMLRSVVEIQVRDNFGHALDNTRVGVVMKRV